MWGVLAFLIRKDIECITERIEDLQIVREILWIIVKAKKPIYIGCYYGPQENSNKDVQAEYEHTTELVGKYQRNHNVIYTHGRLQCEAKPYNSSWEKKKITKKKKC